MEEKHHWYEVGHWVKSFVWDGLIVDGVWGARSRAWGRWSVSVAGRRWGRRGRAWPSWPRGLAISSIPGVGGDVLGAARRQAALVDP